MGQFRAHYSKSFDRWNKTAIAAVKEHKRQEKSLDMIAMHNPKSRKRDARVDSVVRCYGFDCLYYPGNGLANQPVWFIELSECYRSSVAKKANLDAQKQAAARR